MKQLIPSTTNKRIGRIRFALIQVACVAGMIILGILTKIFLMSSEIFNPMEALILLMILSGLVYLSWFVSVLRFHDINYSGWWSLLMPLPLVGPALGLLLCVVPGTKGKNKFGPSPDHLENCDS